MNYTTDYGKRKVGDIDTIAQANEVHQAGVTSGDGEHDGRTYVVYAVRGQVAYSLNRYYILIPRANQNKKKTYPEKDRLGECACGSSFLWTYVSGLEKFL